MKLRLRSEIEKARSKATREERDRLDRALEELELARIGTIHAFCGDLLHERPIEAGIDPLFEVASEEEADEIADSAFEDWFQTILADPPEGVRRILRRRSGRQSPRGTTAKRNADASRAPRFSGALATPDLRPKWRDRRR